MNERNDSAFDVGKLVVGLNIVAIGVYVLLGNIGVVSFGYLPFIIRLWPILLVIVGLNIIFKSQGLSYIGSLVFTAFLVLVIVASAPGQAGSGARKMLAFPEEPVKISVESFTDVFNIDWHGKVKETIDNTAVLERVPETVYLDFGSAWCDNVNIKVVPVERGQPGQIDYTIKIKSDDFDIGNTGIVQTWSENGLTLESPGIQSYFDVELTLLVSPNTNIETKSTVNDIEITDEWFGEISVTHITSGDFKARTLNGTTIIKTTSGDITIEQVNNSIDAHTISGDVEIGGLSNAYKDFIISLQSSYPVTVESDPELYEATMVVNNNISTTSGNIKIKNIEGTAADAESTEPLNLTKTISNLSIQTTSGDINLYFQKVSPGKNTINSTSGDIGITFLKKQAQYAMLKL